MSFTTFVAFVLISAAQVATPGPSTVFLLNNALAYGARRAIVALSGDLVAIVILASLSAAGVGALLAANTALFAVLRIAGAAYLLWLGIQYFRVSPAVSEQSTGAEGSSRSATAGLWLQSFWIGISNPKAVLFFAALFPQFIPADGGPGSLVFLVIAFVTTKLIVLGGYALAARQLRRVFARGGNMAVGRRLTGALFILFGCLMIWPLVA
ncbi:lysine transporter LysE [Bosea sp. Root381]|uniref:LysE family translocator n=1 Tax=Bosea sp. Root381 TaxID=1736524 RepID=UPI0006F89F64|nr:LysE family translocator [Bosea sp. Root381]KRE09734.1 lysine transporter LysE [Bosea sp. Root381]